MNGVSDSATAWRGRGKLVATVCPDGRVVLRLEDGGKGSIWLELMPVDVEWLLEVLESALRTP